MEIDDDWIVTIPIKTRGADGVVGLKPANDIFTAESDTDKLEAMIEPGPDGSSPVLKIRSTVRFPDGDMVDGTVIVTDSSGRVRATLVCGIASEITESNILLDVANATYVMQSLPELPEKPATRQAAASAAPSKKA